MQLGLNIHVVFFNKIQSFRYIDFFCMVLTIHKTVHGSGIEQEVVRLHV